VTIQDQKMRSTLTASSHWSASCVVCPSLEKEWLLHGSFRLPKIAHLPANKPIALLCAQVHSFSQLQGRCLSTLQSSCRARARWIAKLYSRPLQHQSTF
jgi:hypothetical protein